VEREFPTFPETAVFGVPLEVIMERQRRVMPDAKIPLFIKNAMNAILKKGLTLEGVFRLSGTQDIILSLREQLNQGTPHSPH
jgi:hypothetical protein